MFLDNYDHHNNCPIKREQGREPTPEECGKCEHVSGTAMASYFRSYRFFEQLRQFTEDTSHEIVMQILDSDQFNDMMAAIKLMCLMFDPQLMYLKKAGLELELVSIMTNTFVMGYMTALNNQFGELTHGGSKNNSVASEVDQFLADVLKKEDKGDTPDTDPAGS